MKRLVVGLLLVVMGLAIGSPAGESRAWDPQNPPPWIPLEAAPSRSSGDDGGWGGIETTHKGSHICSYFDRCVWKWLISPFFPTFRESSKPRPAVVTEGADEEPSAPAGCN